MKILMVGLGGIGQRHVRNLLTLLPSDEVEIIAYRVRGLQGVITDQLTPESNVIVEEIYKISTYDDLDKALAEQPVAAFICNPSSMHIPAALAAARAGCHLFIEKPLSHCYEGIEELIALLEKKNKMGFVGYQMRFHPALQKLRELLSHRVIGRILSVRVEVGEYLPGFHPYEDYRQLYAARKALGGGVILSQIHEMDYIYWFFGLPRRIFTLGGHLSHLEINVEDIASILMECFMDGQVVPVHLLMDFIQQPPSRTCQVIGDKGKILLDFHVPTVQVFNKYGQLTETHTYENFQRNDMFLDEMRHFLDCLHGKSKPLISLRDGAQSLKMALAALESLDTGRVMELS